MSEVEKMYTLAMVAPTEITVCGIDEEIIHYPPFTTEKQIGLIKILAKSEIKINNEDGEYEFSIFDAVSDFSSFEESLADLTNRIWQDLTEEEKQQVKGILE